MIQAIYNSKIISRVLFLSVLYYKTDLLLTFFYNHIISSYLSTLFIGMQHLQAKNLLPAEEYLLTSSQICESDPIGIKRVGCALFSKAQVVIYYSILNDLRLLLKTILYQVCPIS
ncbi:Anaphase-promoting complex subunit 6 [Gigaspora margarita]|uniref:Anaphase-promoting complex subunit 6 n=1 Tax=Gigaspora margarita TaxID=4874 RepID=A0A8H4A6C6_GIGMA|nr:Anaphase-promoting complex subunit 6 [Gigaspora margarita]